MRSVMNGIWTSLSVTVSFEESMLFVGDFLLSVVKGKFIASCCGVSSVFIFYSCCGVQKEERVSIARNEKIKEAQKNKKWY